MNVPFAVLSVSRIIHQNQRPACKPGLTRLANIATPAIQFRSVQNHSICMQRQALARSAKAGRAISRKRKEDIEIEGGEDLKPPPGMAPTTPSNQHDHYALLDMRNNPIK